MFMCKKGEQRGSNNLKPIPFNSIYKNKETSNRLDYWSLEFGSIILQ